MTNASDHTPLFVALFITAIGLAVLVAARPVWTLRLRTMERQLDRYRRHPNFRVYFSRFFGAAFAIGGIATFFQH